MAIVQKKYIGLLGGSFDPAHKGHLGISKIAIKKFKLKKIYWVIAKKNPFNISSHKTEPRYPLPPAIKIFLFFKLIILTDFNYFFIFPRQFSS